MVMKARRENEKEQRRQAILQAAREVFFDEGFRQATVEVVAERAGISKGTVYLYFQSKETILAHLLLEGLDDLVDKLKDTYASDEPLSAEERLRRMAWMYFEFFQEEPRYLHFLVALDRGRFREVVPPLVYQKVLEASLEGLEWAMRAVEQGIAEGSLRPCDARQAAATVWAALNGVLGLMAHPLRREMIGLRSQVFYEATLETVLRGLQVASL